MALQYSIDVPGCPGVNHADFSIDGRYAIFTCEFSGALVKVDLVERRALGYLKLQMPATRFKESAAPRTPPGRVWEPGETEVCTKTKGMPQDIRISPDGKRFYVADMHADGVHVIDGESFQQIGFIPTALGAHGLYPSRDGRKLYVATVVEQDPWPSEGQGRRIGDRLRDPEGRGKLADPGRRQSGHGQRQRRRQVAVAIGPLRPCRVRVRHEQW
jgi:hypothetical protein